MEWFMSELEDLRRSDRSHYFSFELYCTRCAPDCLDKLHDSGSDCSKWLQIRSGRPDFRMAFEDLNKERYGSASSTTVGLMFCGSVAMGRVIRASSQEAMLHNPRVRYIFKMENF